MKRSIEERLRNPRPGTKIAAAKEFGIDLSLLAVNLRLTVEERVEKLQKAMRSFHEISSEAKRRREERHGGTGDRDTVTG